MAAATQLCAIRRTPTASDNNPSVAVLPRAAHTPVHQRHCACSTAHTAHSRHSPTALLLSVVRLRGQRVDDCDLAVLPPRLPSQLRSEVLYLLLHELLYHLLRHLVLLELEVELPLALRLALDVVESLQVRVGERLVDADALVRVEHQHLVQQVEGERVGVLHGTRARADK